MGLGAKWSGSGGVKFFSQQDQLLTHTHFQKPRPRQSASSNCISFIVSNYGPQTPTWLEHCAGASWEVDTEPSRGSVVQKEGSLCTQPLIPSSIPDVGRACPTQHPVPKQELRVRAAVTCWEVWRTHNSPQLSPRDLHWLSLGSLLGRGGGTASLSLTCQAAQLSLSWPSLSAFCPHQNTEWEGSWESLVGLLSARYLPLNYGITGIL